jgi:adenylyltransferase/sulfurtransferase
MLPELTASEKARYARHLSVPGVGEDGQRRLKASSVLLVGCGGLGAPAALYLAAAGVGRLGLVDGDIVERSNLQRQIIHGESSVGTPKLDSAIARLRDLNPDIELVPHATRLRPDNAAAIAADYDLILDGSDNFATRFLTNDLAFFQRKPCVYGAIFQFDGQVGVFAPHRGGACYRCMIPTTPPPGAAPSCAEAGVLGVLPGVIGSLQAMEAIKWLLDLGEPPLGKLICYDALRSSFRTIALRPDPGCALCGTSPTIHRLDNSETMTDPTCSSADASVPAISVDDLAARLAASSDTVLIDVRQPEEFDAASIPGSRLIPLDQLPERLDEIPRDREVLVHCKSGGRSARAVDFLRQNGVDQAVNVAGGIDAWLKR